MKKTIILFSLSLFYSLAIFAQTNGPTPSVVKFKEVSYNFGTVPYASDVSHKFVFKNISKDRINIREVQTSCGCTTPEYSSAPIKPHRKGSVMVKYDSKRIGHFHKTLEVLFSDQEQIELVIDGDIQVPVQDKTTGTKADKGKSH